jgi:hypothetical protein
MGVASGRAAVAGAGVSATSLGGLAAIVGAYADSPNSPWCSLPFTTVFALCCTSFLVGLWLIGSYIFGWPVPATYQEKLQREIETLRADSARRESFQKVLNELSQSMTYLKNELDADRVGYGGGIDSSAWIANSHLLSAPEFDTQRELVEEAYRQTGEVARQERERFEQADEADLSKSSSWWALSEEERQVRQNTLRALRKAWLAVVDVEIDIDSKKRTKRWQIWKR